MITVFLENERQEKVAVCARSGNCSYLCQTGDEFEMLSQVDTASYTVFGRPDLNVLIDELNQVAEHLEHDLDRQHVAQIVRLAERCMSNPRWTLSFTPFGE